MNSRERWTVYPLLFLTLGIALTDKLTRQVQTDRVICKNLLVTDRQGKPQVVVASAANGGNLLVNDRDGKPQVVVASTAGGGIVQTQANGPGLNVVLGHYPTVAGLWFTNANDVPVGPSLIFPTPRRQRPHSEATPPATPPAEEAPPAKDE